ncbi:MAG: zinc-ribbon domain-containing protein [Clostridia bacterium]|nr:zinc-ribbon domain-containing protein [Clostridia bacterium]
MFCDKCGAQIEANSKFCGKCGSIVPVFASEKNDKLVDNNVRRLDEVDDDNVRQLIDNLWKAMFAEKLF